MAEQVQIKKNLPATEEPVKEEKGLSDDACVATFSGIPVCRELTKQHH
jgi:hypothetical protein